MSIAETLQVTLEARGEYVVRANTNWFAMFPSTWQHRVDAARRDGREGPNLVVYRTNPSDPRDHHAIPYSTIRQLLLDETLAASKAGGRRWNLVLKEGILRVTHSTQRHDVRQCHRAVLLAEELSSDEAPHGSKDWRPLVSEWTRRRRYDPRDVERTIAYFERAFRHTRCVDRAWFGAQGSTISLVVGGIFLAAIFHHSSDERGIWLLLDGDPAQIDGIDYRPVKSTKKSPHKLRWAHAASLDCLDAILQIDALWESFSRASEKILFSGVAADRDEVQRRRGKLRLGQLLPPVPAASQRTSSPSRVLPPDVAKRATIERMASTARDTVAKADGRKVSRTLKVKDLRFASRCDFERHIEELVDKQHGLCAITRLPLQFDGRCSDPELQCSLDRIDSSGHYEPENLQVVCKFINRWKNDSDDAEFRRLITLLMGVRDTIRCDETGHGGTSPSQSTTELRSAHLRSGDQGEQHRDGT